MSDNYRCGHPKTPDNSVKSGLGRMACKVCKQAANRRVREQYSAARTSHQTIAGREGGNLSDPNRADKLLRRFSWEDA